MDKAYYVLFIGIILSVIGGSLFLASRLPGRADEDSKQGELILEELLSDASKQVKVEEYIRGNIGTLSPEPEVLSGQFFVTNIAFDPSRNIGMVEYEDGHNAYTASFAYSVSENGTVKISSFTLATEEIGETKSDFIKSGNLVRVAGRDAWYLLYEEPGKPAIKTELIFTNATVCDLGQGVSCGNNSFWKEGDRVRVSGLRQGESVRVEQITKNNI